MKKCLAILAAFALLLCLGACTGRPQPSPGPEPTPAAAVTATPAPAPEAPPSSTPESAPTPTPEPTPSPTPEPAPSPTQEPEDPTEPLLGEMKRENAESIRYELGSSWGETYLLHRGEEGFEEALDILFSLRGVRCEKPEVLASRSFDLGRQVELAYDGEYVYGGSYNGHRWLRLEGEGRPDQALSAIFERCAPALSGVGGLAPSHENLIRDDTLTLHTSSPVYDLETLTNAIQGMHESYKESGNRAVDELAEIYLIRDNRTEETIFIDTPVLEMLVDGEWHYRHFRSSGSFLMYGQAEPGETVLNIPMWRLAGELEPGQYRICVTYFLGGEATSPDHVAYAEFEIAEDGPETPIPPLPWLEEALEAYERAEEAYCWFTIHSIPNDLSVDREVSDGGFFYLITDPRFATWETLENYLLSLFDRATVERLLPGAYKEFDGRVYGADADAGGLWYVGERTGIRVWREMNGKVYVAVSYEYLSEEDGTPAGEFTCTYPYVWEGDHRVFRDFSLPYVDGIPADFEED